MLSKKEEQRKSRRKSRREKAIALSLLAQNVAPEIIVQATGLSIEEFKNYKYQAALGIESRLLIKNYFLRYFKSHQYLLLPLLGNECFLTL